MIKLQSKRTKKIYYAYESYWKFNSPTVECFDKDVEVNGFDDSTNYKFPKKLLQVYLEEVK